MTIYQLLQERQIFCYKCSLMSLIGGDPALVKGASNDPLIDIMKDQTFNVFAKTVTLLFPCLTTASLQIQVYIC